MENIFSKRLKEERINKKFTQQQLADLINKENLLDTKISRNSITRYENGTRTPNYDILSAISTILNIDVDYLIGKSNKKYSELINDDLHQFINLLNNIIDNDNEHINDKLLDLLNDFSNLVEQGIKHNILDLCANIISYIDMTINKSINNNDPNLIKNLEKIIIANLQSSIKMDNKIIASNYVSIVLEKVKLNGISSLDEIELRILKDFYYDHNIDDIPDIIKGIFLKEGE